MSGAENKAVFLSYASQDAEAARRICEALRGAGVEVWFDQNELVGGDAWDAKIRRQIATCALFVPIISANTQARGEGYFRLEWKLAVDRSHLMAHDQPFLLPVAIDGTTDGAARVPAEFRAVQWTRLPAGETSDRFCGYVRRLVEGGSATSVAATGASTSAQAAVAGARVREKRSWKFVTAVAAAVLLAGAAGWWLIRDRAGAPEASVQPAATTDAGPADTLAKVRRLRAKIDVSRADLETASGLLELADRQHPNNPEIWAEWSLVDARFLDELLDRSDARQDAMRQRGLRAYGLAPDSAVARLAHATALAWFNPDNAGVLAQARALLEPLAERPEVDPDVLVLLSEISRDRKNPGPSFHFLDRLASMPGGAARAHFERGMALVFGERWAAAEIAFDRALTYERAGRILLGKAYVQTMWQGDLAGARQSIAEIPAVSLQEDFPATACFWIHTRARDWERALAVMRALPRDYLDSGALSGPTAYFKGWVLARMGKTAAAEVELRSALEVVETRLKARPNVRSLLVAKALVQVALGDREAAERTRRLVVELYGEEPVAWPDSLLTAELLPPAEAIRAYARLVDSSAMITSARLRLDPYLDRLRGHPDFAALQMRVDGDPRLSPRAAQAAGPASPVADAKSVAVLAFENRSSEKDSEYFSDGVSDELINVLGRVAGLKVVAPTSSFAFRGNKAASAQEIAGALGVNHLVAGSVQQAGGKARVIARLIRADTSEQLWGDSFETDVKDIFSAQVTTARAIAEALTLRLNAGLRMSSLHPDAVKLYLQGRQEWGLRTIESMRRAEDLFTRAIALEPKFARAHSGLVDAWVVLGQQDDSLGLFGKRDSVEMRRVIERARLAVALDPDSAEAQASLAGALMEAWQPVEARQALEQAVALNPNYATAHHWLARALLTEGRAAEAIASWRRACELDPLSSRMADNRGFGLWLVGRAQEGLAELDRALRLQPDSEQAKAQRSTVLAAEGRRDEAVAQARETLTRGGWLPMHAVSTLAIAGQQEEAARAFASLPKTQAMSRCAFALAALGRWDECLAALQPATMVTASAHQMLFHAVFDPIRSDPRFVTTLEMLSLTEAHARAQAWRAANSPQKVPAKK